MPSLSFNSFISLFIVVSYKHCLVVVLVFCFTLITTTEQIRNQFKYISITRPYESKYDRCSAVQLSVHCRG
jgi:hypothetical protein